MTLAPSAKSERLRAAIDANPTATASMLYAIVGGNSTAFSGLLGLLRPELCPVCYHVGRGPECAAHAGTLAELAEARSLTLQARAAAREARREGYARRGRAFHEAQSENETP